MYKKLVEGGLKMHSNVLRAGVLCQLKSITYNLDSDLCSAKPILTNVKAYARANASPRPGRRRREGCSLQ